MPYKQMKRFEYDVLSNRVLFGIGTVNELPIELARLQGKRALIISTPKQRDDAEMIRDLLGSLCAGIFSGASMHTPIEVTNEAMGVVQKLAIDCLIGIGGGSTIGLSKAIALRTDLPQIVVPTTYAGSEMTPILGQTENGKKTTLRDPKVLPEVVIYDVRLTLSLPPSISGVSGMNAIAHAVEALYAENQNPLTSLMAEDGIKHLSRALPMIAADPKDTEARTNALFGAWLCASCLAAVGMALHHKLCHILGGAFDLPHAETHTAVLPHSAAYNAPADEDAMCIVARALNCKVAPQGLFELGRKLNVTLALRDLGLKESDLDHAADLALQDPYWNPRPIERIGIRELLRNAWAGEPPVLAR